MRGSVTFLFRVQDQQSSANKEYEFMGEPTNSWTLSLLLFASAAPFCLATPQGSWAYINAASGYTLSFHVSSPRHPLCNKKADSKFRAVQTKAPESSLYKACSFHKTKRQNAFLQTMDMLKLYV